MGSARWMMGRVGLGSAALCAIALTAQAVTFQNLYHFEAPPNHPRAALVLATNGLLYGTTYNGGTYGQGAIFKISTSGVYSNLWSFTGGGDGAYPFAGLLAASDGALYGTASKGDTLGGCVVFKLTTANVMTSLYSLDRYLDGDAPCAGLIQGADGALYGAAAYGGTNGRGTVFRMTTDGVYSQLWTFTGGADGSYPKAKLVQGADSALYGVCSSGGSNSLGTVFRITTNGTMKPLWSFTGGNDGSQPEGELAVSSNGVLVGQTQSGGTAGAGVVFKITTNGVLTPLWQFTNSGGDGGHPRGGIWRSTNGWFYGTTANGGTNYGGTIFKITTNGTMTPLWSFRTQLDGYRSECALFQASNGAFYGTARYGGSNEVGTVFKYVEGAGLTQLWSFQAASNGIAPEAGLAAGPNGTLYGTTTLGASNDLGAVFRRTTNGAVSRLWAFSGGWDGHFPRAELLVDSNGTCHGTTENSGNYGWGTAFDLATNGTMSAYSFPGATNGAGLPHGGVVRGPDQAFYGTTYYGGVSNLGAVYRLATNGTATLLHSFTGPDGSKPLGTLAGGSNGVFYGVTEYGGSNDFGTVYRVATNGAFATLWHFTDIPDGKHPWAGLILASDGALYGTTREGGFNGGGSVFRITTNGVKTNLWSFKWDQNGSSPHARLLQAKDGALYGTTVDSGSNYLGTVFRITLDGQLTTLWSFTGGTNGGYSYAGLVQVGDWLYGTTTLNDGTLFRIALQPTIYVQPPGGSNRVVTWSNAACLLQSATNAVGVYTNIAGAASPYTNRFMDPARFFRLKLTNAP